MSECGIYDATNAVFDYFGGVADLQAGRLRFVGDPAERVAEDYLRQQGWADTAALDGWRADAVRKVEEAIAQVQREPAPDQFQEDWCALATRRLAELHEEP